MFFVGTVPVARAQGGADTWRHAGVMRTLLPPQLFAQYNNIEAHMRKL